MWKNTGTSTASRGNKWCWLDWQCRSCERKCILCFWQTRVLVTHGMSFLPQADLILVLVDGVITESGSYQELLNRKGCFADFIRTFASSERKESSVQRGQSNTFIFTASCCTKQCSMTAENMDCRELHRCRFQWVLLTAMNVCCVCRVQKILCKAQCNRFHAVLQGPLSGAADWVNELEQEQC